MEVRTRPNLLMEYLETIWFKKYYDLFHYRHLTFWERICMIISWILPKKYRAKISRISPDDLLTLRGLEVGVGWRWILKDAFKQMHKLNDPAIKVSQVKEKFGTLRLYLHPYDGDNPDNFDIALSIANQAAALSSEYCEECGFMGKYRGDLPWKRTLCDDCHELLLIP